jgi:acetyltransferase-like isoleucine patch superfamily enzyme
MSTKSNVSIHPTAIVYDNVKLGDGTMVGPFAIIGEPPRGHEPGQLETIIGVNSVIRSHTVIYAGNKIGDNFQTGHKANIRETNTIGNNVSIGTHSIVEHHVEIEDNVRIHSNVFLPEFSLLKKGCWIGPNVVFTNAKHPLCPDAKACLKGPTIEEGAKLGANITILPDVRVGTMALIGAGSVVAKDVEAFAVMAGNPAKFIKRIEDLECNYGTRDKPY